MFAHLYAVRENSAWRWNVTLDWSADCRFWSFESGNAQAVFVAPRLSLGQALWLADRWNKEVFRAYAGFDDGPERVLSEWKRLKRAGREAIPFSVESTEEALCLVRQPPGEVEAFDPDAKLIERLAERLAGRALLGPETERLLAASGWTPEHGPWTAYVQWLVLSGCASVLGGVEIAAKRRFGFGKFGQKKQWSGRCRRCGETERLYASFCPYCGSKCPYCEACLTMGRSRFCGLLVVGKDGRVSSAAIQPPGEIADIAAKWRLSRPQADAAGQALAFLRRQLSAERLPDKRRTERNSRGFLLWAVTGAGKTEMMFPLVEAVLASKGRVAIASPRRDVVLELEPRLRRAFSEVQTAALYGGSRQLWDNAELVVTTTHQLIRFWRAFDLVVLDEIDAFPFRDDERLSYLAQKACRENGVFVFLTATPTPAMIRAVRSGRLPCATVPVRHHGRPLPVPRVTRSRSIRAATVLPGRVADAVRESLARGAQVFVFVPEVALVERAVGMLQAAFPGVAVGGVSARDAGRDDVVCAFRRGDIRVLVATTVLERGVTVPKTDVVVLDADAALFDEAALVQMAGRAGRSTDDADGRVRFFVRAPTRAVRRAVRHIRCMNRLAQRKGYLRQAPKNDHEEELSSDDKP